MKTFKRNAVIITVLLFVGAAVYLNWSYGRSEKEIEAIADSYSQTEPVPAEETDTDGGTGLYYSKTETGAEDSSSGEYFAAARLNRKQARDEATQTLRLVSESAGASEETVNNALAEITSMAAWSVEESELENLILAKGYKDCVAFISDEGVTVTVQAEEGLSNADVARITDIVTTETNFSADDLKIIEIK